LVRQLNQKKCSKLLKAGFNVMRLNFSHGDFAEHQGKVDNLRKAIKKTEFLQRSCKIFPAQNFDSVIFIKNESSSRAGDYITLTTDKIIGNEQRVSVNYPTLHEEILPGNIIMVDDGKKKFEVVSIEGHEIKCKIFVGGDTKADVVLNFRVLH
jgi:pyruvate kinase